MLIDSWDIGYVLQTWNLGTIGTEENIFIIKSTSYNLTKSKTAAILNFQGQFSEFGMDTNLHIMKLHTKFGENLRGF